MPLRWIQPKSLNYSLIGAIYGAPGDRGGGTVGGGHPGIPGT